MPRFHGTKRVIPNKGKIVSVEERRRLVNPAGHKHMPVECNGCVRLVPRFKMAFFS